MGLPPHALKYNIFTPQGPSPTCATYGRKDLGLKPRVLAQQGRTIIAIAVTIDDRIFEAVNIYAPSKTEKTWFPSDHTPATNSIMTGDFNTHHGMSYGDKSDNKALIRNSARSVDFLVEWAGHFGFTLQNTPEVFTHFPSNGNQPSIIDLTFARGHANTIMTGWSCDAGSGGDSDHAATIISLLIKTPTFILRRLLCKTDWADFDNHIRNIEIPHTAGADGPGALASLDVRIQETIDIAVPRSSRRAKSKRWWTPEISQLKAKLATVQHSNMAHPHDPGCTTARKRHARNGGQPFETHNGHTASRPSTRQTGPLQVEH